jgi:hypothetical protein
MGATDPYRFRLELLRMVDHKLKQSKSLDLFVVAGDIFDMKEYFSSDTLKVFFLIMKELLEMTKDYGTQFRFIEGTRTHDAKQLETLDIIFTQLMNNDRIKIFSEVNEESVLGLDILYIPEEYVIDSELYYKPYFMKHYDFIFGHGPTDLMWYMNKTNSEPVEKHSAATVFKADDLCKVAQYSYFGHFHYNIASGIDGRFKSIGTVSRWEFDKDGKCGFYYVEYDTTTKLAIEEYVQNEYAPILPTVAFSIKKDYDLEDLKKKIMERLNKVKDTADKTRLIVTINPSLNTFIVMRDFVLASFGNIPNVKLMLKATNPDTESESTNESKSSPISEEQLMEERPYLYDKSMQDEAKIAAFIKKKAGANISLENILEVINPKDSRIKSREE